MEVAYQGQPSQYSQAKSVVTSYLGHSCEVFKRLTSGHRTSDTNFIKYCYASTPLTPLAKGEREKYL